MAREYLAEGLKGSFPFIADTSKIVVESLPNGQTRTRIPGRFSVCDCVNGNGRRYAKRVWEKNFENGSTLMQSIAENAAFGLLEHPKDGQVTLQSPICILTTAAKLQEGRDQKTGKGIWEVVGEIGIVGTEEGKKLTALIEAGYNPRVSSRGFGSLVKATDGIDDVQEDFICEGWDVVMKPSFESAVLNPQRESAPAPVKTTESKPAPAAPISETAPVTTTTDTTVITTAVVPGQPPIVAVTPGKQTNITLEAERGSQAPTAGVSAPAKPTTESSQSKTMQISEIKSQIAGYQGKDMSKLSPAQFAEGMSQLGSLHQEIANYVAEDVKRSYDGTRLHKQVEAIENTWSQTQLAPGKKASKLQEDNTKLMQVIKAVTQTAVALKGKIGESVKQQGRQAALLKEITERGQAWAQRAKAMQAEATKYQRRFMMASEALHQFANKYKTDITMMGKAHLTMEFKDKIDAPEFQALLKEATKPKALVPIRLALEGKITTDIAKSILEGKVSLDETLKSIKGATQAAPVTESKSGAAVPPVAAPAKGSPTAPVSEGVKVMSTVPGDPRGLTEAVAMVSRLSTASKA